MTQEDILKARHEVANEIKTLEKKLKTIYDISRIISNPLKDATDAVLLWNRLSLKGKVYKIQPDDQHEERHLSVASAV
jgi:hypothetical protein